MQLSVFDLFKIGIGPSSSHTVGPMRAARRFVERLVSDGSINTVARVRCDLFGSLALTGLGHGTDKAIILGLSGEQPETVDPNSVDSVVADVRSTGRIVLLGRHAATYREADDLVFHRDESLPEHPNGLRLSALAADGGVIAEKEFYSVGGGFVISADGDGTHFVPLDQVIETMRQTGHDMQDKYKETSQGGLSVNVIDC